MKSLTIQSLKHLGTMEKETSFKIFKWYYLLTVFPWFLITSNNKISIESISFWSNIGGREHHAFLMVAFISLVAFYSCILHGLRYLNVIYQLDLNPGFKLAINILGKSRCSVLCELWIEASLCWNSTQHP